MLERAFATLARRRFPGAGDEVSRWTVRVGGVPADCDALVVLSVEELAVNELRETLHHWVRTVVFPIRGATLCEPLPHQPAVALRGAISAHDGLLTERAADLLDDVVPALKQYLTSYADELTEALRVELARAGELAKAEEEERYRSRQGEVSTLIQESTLAKLEREIAKLKVERQQGTLFDHDARLDELDRSIEEKQAEIQRRRRHYEEVRSQLERERERIVRYLLPRRHAMPTEAQVFPVCIEIRLREACS
jgi:hypothetical protein